MKKFPSHLVVSAAVLSRSDVNTDVLMPKGVLKKIEATGYGDFFFDPWRFKDKCSLDKALSDRELNPNFELNKFEKMFGHVPDLLIVNGTNFGSGSSREHAVWGAVQYGLRVIIGYSDGDKVAFADIFRNNSAQKGLLLIELPKKDVEYLADTCALYHKHNGEMHVGIDLGEQLVIAEGKEFPFSIDARAKNKLLKGLDDSDEIAANFSDDIRAYDERIARELPFLHEPINL